MSTLARSNPSRRLLTKGLFLRWILLIFMLVLISNTVIDTRDNPASQPNILFLLADDLGYADLGVYGNREILSPNIDQLAREGIRFTQFYTNGSICTPTRVALLTGMYPQRFGIREGLRSQTRRGISSETPTLPELLRQAEYKTMHVGKWHMGHAEKRFRPLAQGYDTFFGFLHAWFLPRTYYNPMLQRDEGRPSQHSGHLTDILTMEATAFLRRQVRSEKPFFLTVWFFSPHGPLEPPPRWAKRYDPTDRGRYQALVSTLDENVGLLLRTLEETGQENDTIVVFASDNGGTLRVHGKFNGPFRGGKNQFTEGGIRVPLIVRWPGQAPANKVSDDLVMSFDWYATLAELAGATQASRSDGRSIVPILRGTPANAFEGSVFWEDFGKNAYRFAVRRENWKLLFEEGRASLFDLDRDFSESKDLSSQNPWIVEELTNAYRKWRLQTARISVEARDETVRHPLLNPHDGELTLSMWICPGAEEAPSEPIVLAQKGESWKLSWLQTGALQVEAGGAVLSGSILLPQKTCSHVAFSFFHPGTHGLNEEGVLSLFINARSDGSVRTPHPVSSSGEDARIGGLTTVRTLDPRFYNTALSGEELRYLMEESPISRTPE